MEFPLDGFDAQIYYTEQSSDKNSLKIKTADVLKLEIGSRKYQRVQRNSYKTELMEVLIDGAISLYKYVKVVNNTAHTFSPTNNDAILNGGVSRQTEKYFVQKKGDLIPYKKSKIEQILTLFMADNDDLIEELKALNRRKYSYFTDVQRVIRKYNKWIKEIN